MQNHTYFSHTRHSQARTRQRGVKSEVIDVVFEYADIERPCGSGCFELSITRKKAAWLVRMGQISAQVADKCSRVKMIMNGSTVITVYKNDN